MLEAAFEARLTGIANAAPDGPQNQRPEPQDPKPNGHQAAPILPAIQEVIVLSKPVRDRDRVHLRFVAGRPCLVCGRTPSDPHHVKFAENWTAGRKVSDRFTVPLCRLHHHELHRRGNERGWWQQKGIDPLQVARALWDKTHAAAPDEIAADRGHAINDSDRVGRAELAKPQNHETKPIVGPEAR